MKEIKVQLKLADNSYGIKIGRNLLGNLVWDFKRNSIANKYIIITDSRVKILHGRNLLGYFRNAKLKHLLLSFKSGEKNKNFRTVNYLYKELLKRRVGRDSAIIAFGGGVVGDVAGFVAATLYRGIPYVQVPTTLLAQADSSVGGKVGINHALGKNLIGAFWQPKAVFVDVEILKTLPRKEILNGLAEIIKHAIIGGEEFFNFVDKNLKRILNLDSLVMEELIWRNCQLKSLVVAKDEKEKGVRKILNFGHTIGHAIELLSNYKISHGKAVAIGMAAEIKIAEKLGLLGRVESEAIIQLIKRAGLPVVIPNGISISKIILATKFDKKNMDGIPEYVLPFAIGKIKYGLRIKQQIIKSVLEKMR